MRIIGEKNKGKLKATAFKYNEKLSVKYEKNLNEIILKFRDGSIQEADLIQEYLSDEVLSKYEDLLDNGENLKVDSLIKIEKDKGLNFPEII